MSISSTDRYEINELRNVLAAHGLDNYTHAICVIAVDGGLPADDIEGLTEAEHKRLVATYGDGVRGWNRDLCIEHALAAALA